MSSTTHFENIASEIIKELSNATTEIKVALAWFTDSEIIKILEQKVEGGVSVELILAQNEHNEESKYADLKSRGAEVMYVPWYNAQ
jgi:phosphatidylserine/phosphatidylglycerophosphate/cardiolipin synthase-like enzyme